jgi:hypothetical protein
MAMAVENRGRMEAQLEVEVEAEELDEVEGVGEVLLVVHQRRPYPKQRTRDRPSAEK